MEEGRSGRGRKRAASEAAPEPASKTPSRKTRRGDSEEQGAAGGAASSSREGKAGKGSELVSAHEHGKRTRSAQAAGATSEEPSSAESGSRSAKEGKEAKKEAAAAESKDGRGKSRRAEKQAETVAPSNGAAASTASIAASASGAASASTSAAAAASAALAMAGAHPGDLFPSSGLRRLLADRGFDELPMTIGMLRGGSNSRFRSLLDGLRAEGDLSRQEGALTELCDMLCMATEETLQGFSMDSFLPPLIALINCEASPEIMLQACRGIAYILEAIPQSSADVVRYGSIAPLCSKLMAIQYIDVAEQALMTLHKISKDHASHAQLLQARGVSAVLSYLDFFPLSVQRTGMETVSNMCKRVSLDSLHFVVDSIPQLSQMLLHSDSKLAEHVCMAFCRLVTSLGGQKEALEQVAGVDGVISNVWSLTSNCLTDGASSGDKNSSQPMAAFGVELCSQLLHMLAMLASASPKLGMDILAQPDVGQVLRSKILLEKLGESSATENRRRSSMDLSSRSSPQLLREIMALTSSLLPALPLFPPKEAAKADLPKECKAKGGKTSKKARTTPALASALDVHLGSVDKGEEAKSHWTKNSEMLEQLGEQLLEATLSMSSLSIDGTLRLDALTALCKLVHYMPGEKVSKLLPRQQVCELMSALLASESLQLRFIALVLIHDLMTKCGDAFSSLFTREGIVYAVHKLQETGPASSSAPPKREEKVASYVPPSWAAMRPAVPAKSGNNMQEATEAVFESMLAFVSDRHLPTSAGVSKDGDERLTTVVSELRDLGAAMVKAGEEGNEDVAKENLTKIISYFEDSSKVSTFEMRCSGVCENLIRFIAPDCPGSKTDVSDKGKDAADTAPETKTNPRGRGRKGGKHESKNIGSSPSAPKTSLEAMRDRWDIFISLVKEKHDGGEDGVTTPARSLVHKLVAALNNTDGFGSSPAPQQGPEAEVSWSKQSRLITLPLRLRFERCVTAKDSHKLKEYINPVVIDPLASISAIHDFLWPRVRRLAHEMPAVAPVPLPRPSARAEQTSSAAASAAERPRRSATGKGAADESMDSHAGRPKRESKSKGSGGGAAGGAAASSLRGVRDNAEADDVAALRGLFPRWPGPAGLGLGAEDEMLSDDDGHLADGMPVDDMVTATLLGGGVDEEGFDHGEMEDDMDLDHEGQDETMQAQRAQVLDIQLSNEGGASSPPLPSLSAHGGHASAEGLTRDRGGASAARGTRGGTAAASSSSGGARAGASADFGESSAAGATGSSGRAGGAGGAAAREEATSWNTPLGLGAGPHLRLSIGGKVLENHDVSIIEAVLMSLTETSGGGSPKSSAGAAGAASASGAKAVHDPRSALWGSKDRTPVHVVEFAPIACKADVSSSSESDIGSSRMGLLKTSTEPVNEPVQARAGAILGAGSEGGISLEDLGLPSSTAAMLRLVAVLQSIHADLAVDDPCRVSAGELVVGNLSSKASCMIRDPLTVFMHKLPDWVRVLLTRFPFLVAHDVRLTFFDLEAFGLVRALKNAGRNRDGRSDRQQNLGHTQHRQKVRVGRKNIMESAKHVMEIYTQNTEKAGWTLEVEFSGEVGVGKGPTQEFFTFFCRELQQRKLGLWWDMAAQGGKSESASAQDAQGGSARGAATDKSEVQEHVCPAHGLFPSPMAATCSPADRKKKIEAFQVMGWVCAKAMHDGRLLDLPMSKPLCHTLLNRPLEVGDMALVCPDVYKTLLKLQQIVKQKKAIHADDKLSADAKAEAVKALTYDGVALEDLSLYFTVPGYDSVILKEEGGDILLTVDNVDEYVELLPKIILVDSIRPQLEAFRNGFSRVFPMGSLRLFCGDELQELFGSDQGTMDWNPEQLLHVFKFEHGYKSSSGVARLLCQVLAELPVEAKRKFISFCTGCPRLPVGGFAALKPPLTVVKKEVPKEASQSALDMQLPSVMTCANYLKLPDYASPTVLRDRLLVAVNEADGSFHLS